MCPNYAIKYMKETLINDEINLVWRLLNENYIFNWDIGEKCRRIFNLLKESNITKIIDIRNIIPRNLPDFPKDDLRYFLKEICDAEYEHETSIATPETLLNKYKKDHDWGYYEKEFNKLLRDPSLKKTYDRILEDKHTICLLCSENKPDKCHRRLILEYIKNNIQDIKIIHLMKK